MTTATTTMTETELRKRLDHLRFTEADARLLESLRPWAETALKDFSREFFNQQFANPDFAAIVRGNSSSQAVLEQAQAGYALDLFKGYPTLNYVASRVSIGKTHVRINITPEWYIASYQFYYAILYPMVRSQFEGEEETGEQAVGAINKLLVFDQSLIMDTYVGGLTDQLQAVMDRVAEQIGGTADRIADASDQLSKTATEAGQAAQGIAATSQQVALGSQTRLERTEEISNGMGQLTAAIDGVTAGSQQQAAAVEQASGIIKQVSTATHEVATSSQAANDGSKQAAEAAQSGKATVNDTVEGMA